MKKALKSISIVLCAVIAVSAMLTGCGNKVKELTVSEHIKSGQTVWYYLDDSFGKDAEVEKIYVMNDDNTLFWADDIDESFGTFCKMDEKEVIEFAENKMNERIEQKINNCIEQAMNDSEGNYVDGQYDELFDKYREAEKYEKFKLVALTDSTGNNIEAEGFVRASPRINYDHQTHKIVLYEDNVADDIGFGTTIGFATEKSGNCSKIYDALLAGFHCYNNQRYFDNELCFVTRFDKDVILKLDSIDSKDLMIDPEFEEVEELLLSK